MSHYPAEVAMKMSRSRLALWVLLFFYAGANVLPLFPHALHPAAYAASQIVPAMLFALVHGARAYRFRGVLSFALISLVIGYLMETIGVLTGFPFGHYYFTTRMGPKLFGVPIMMGPAYLGMGYIAWTVAGVILADEGRPAGLRTATLPLAASFIMVAWDLSFDPALSTFGHYWIWQRGGAYFGVPVSNFLGWFLTNYLIYQLFTLHQRRRAPAANPLPLAEARLAVLFYAVCAAGCILRAASNPSPAVVADPTGALWRVRDINNVCALAAIFVMGAFVVLAFARLTGRTSALELTEYEGREARCGSETSVLQQDKVEQQS